MEIKSSCVSDELLARCHHPPPSISLDECQETSDRLHSSLIVLRTLESPTATRSPISRPIKPIRRPTRTLSEIRVARASAQEIPSLEFLTRWSEKTKTSLFAQLDRQPARFDSHTSPLMVNGTFSPPADHPNTSDVHEHVHEHVQERICTEIASVTWSDSRAPSPVVPQGYGCKNFVKWDDVAPWEFDRVVRGIIADAQKQSPFPYVPPSNPQLALRISALSTSLSWTEPVNTEKTIEHPVHKRYGDVTSFILMVPIMERHFLIGFDTSPYPNWIADLKSYFKKTYGTAANSASASPSGPPPPIPHDFFKYHLGLDDPYQRPLSSTERYVAETKTFLTKLGAIDILHWNGLALSP